MIRNYSDAIVPMVEKALAKYDRDAKDRVMFEVILAFGQPTPEQPPGFFGLLITTMPSPLVGNTLFGLSQFVPVGITQETVNAMVKNAVESLHQERSKALAADKAPTNGGLHLPGQ